MSAAGEQVPASLLRPDEKPAGVLPLNPNGAPAPVDAPAPALPEVYGEDWVRRILILFGKGLADEFDEPKLRMTELELGLMAPTIHALMRTHAPEFVAGNAASANWYVFGGLALWMGGRRGLLILRLRARRIAEEERAREHAQRPASTPPPRAAAAAPSPAPPAPRTYGGQLGDGRTIPRP